MLLFIYLGARAGKIAVQGMMDTTCPVCNEKDSFMLTTLGRYMHSFWIPLFPIGRTYKAQCSNCETTFKKKDAEKFVNNAWEFSVPFEKAKRPWWHWFGIGLIGTLIALYGIIFAIGYPIFEKELNAYDKDPRNKALKADLRAVDQSNVLLTDTLGEDFLRCMNAFDDPEWKEEYIHYLLKRNGEKTLLLMDYDYIKNVDARERKHMLLGAQQCLKQNDWVNADSLYLALHGKWNLLLTKTPKGESLGGRFASDTLLLGFYDGLVSPIDSIPETTSNPLE